VDPVNVPAKFEVRSFTRSWVNTAGTKEKLWAVLGYAVQSHPRSLISVTIESAWLPIGPS